MNSPRRQIFLPLPPLSVDAAIELIDVLEAAVAELWGVYGHEIRELSVDHDTDDTPTLNAGDDLPDDEPF